MYIQWRRGIERLCRQYYELICAIAPSMIYEGESSFDTHYKTKYKLLLIYSMPLCQRRDRGALCSCYARVEIVFWGKSLSSMTMKVKRFASRVCCRQGKARRQESSQTQTPNPYCWRKPSSRSLCLKKDSIRALFKLQGKGGGKDESLSTTDLYNVSCGRQLRSTSGLEVVESFARH